MAVDRDTVKKLKKTVVEDEAPPPPGSRKTIWDSEVKGFGLRVTSSGRRSYVLRYRMGGGGSSAPRTYTIGQHGSPWTVDQARRRALDLLAQVRSGVDPAEERAAASAAVETGREEREKRLFPVLADRWFRHHVVAGGLRSEKDIWGVLERDLKPALADVAIDEITKESVAELMERIGDRSRDAANKAMKWLRQMLNWLVGKGALKESPLDGVGLPYPEGRRTRTLSLSELVVLWVALDDLPDPFRSFYRLLILLGQRLREVANLPWSELDVDAGDWIIPGARTKNKREHLVPMSEQAMSILEALQPDEGRRRGRSPWAPSPPTPA